MFSQIFYLQISDRRVRLSLNGSAAHYEDSPVMAISKTLPDRTILAIGRSAELLQTRPDVEIFRPFSHARAAVADYVIASKMLQHAAQTLAQALPFSQRLRLGMKLIVHPERQFEGGLTDVEQRAFLELGHSIGARVVKLHTGPALLPSQIGGYNFHSQ